MRDYSTNLEERKLFISNYSIADSVITINYASGDSETIPYTRENEEKLRKIMKVQVENFDSIENRSLTVINIFSTLGYLALLISAIVGGSGLGRVIFFSSGSLLGTFFSIHFIKQGREHKKLTKFLENKMQINTYLNNDNLLNNVSVKAKKQIEKSKVESETHNKTHALDLNEMDSISLRDLKKILLNLDRIQKFGFDYLNTTGDDSAEPTGMVRTMQPPHGN